MATFLVGGLWHGAGWTFVLWGFLHGAATVVHRVWTKLEIDLPRFLAWFITINFINITWVFFRARTWEDALRILRAMTGMHGMELSSRFERLGINFGSLVFMHVNKNIFYVLALLMLIAALVKNSNDLSETFKPNWKNASAIIIIAFYTLLSLHNVTEFLYFNF
jgi:D-alanyl-lipoteichoic acid acyltransferase DltB (MBOAT superfamily)